MKARYNVTFDNRAPTFAYAETEAEAREKIARHYPMGTIKSVTRVNIKARQKEEAAEIRELLYGGRNENDLRNKR